MQPTDVRRHPDNSIDYGFYRRRAARLRTEMMRESVRGMASTIKPRIRPLVAIALLLGTVLAVPTRAPQVPDRATDVAATEARDRLTAN
jgi:hypothetical protein